MPRIGTNIDLGTSIGRADPSITSYHYAGADLSSCKQLSHLPGRAEEIDEHVVSLKRMINANMSMVSLSQDEE
jgi:hypothetical protein